MYAAYIVELGGPEDIRYGRLPPPRPGPTDVLVWTSAVAVDAVDTFVRSGAYRTATPFPFVVGRDAVGVVQSCGPGVTRFAPGAAVWCNSLGHAGRQGAAAELVIVAQERLYALPQGVGPVEMAALAHPAATAYLALFTHGGLRPGDIALVAGAAGHVGRAATVLAAAAGARVIATASRRDLAGCLDRGAVAALDYRDPHLTEAIAAAAANIRANGGDGDPARGGVDVHLDTSGHHDLEAAVSVLARGARVVLMAGLGARPVLTVGELYTRDAQLVGFAISNAGTTDLALAAARVNELAAAGSLRPGSIQKLAGGVGGHRAREAGVRRCGWNTPRPASRLLKPGRLWPRSARDLRPA